MTPATGGGFDRRAERAVYDPGRDPTRNVQAAEQEPVPAGPSLAPAGRVPSPGAGARVPASPGMALFQKGKPP